MSVTKETAVPEDHAERVYETLDASGCSDSSSEAQGV
jgi:hypothetical protein